MSPVSVGLGIAWGVVLAWPIVRTGRRRGIAERSREVRTSRSPTKRSHALDALWRLPVVRVALAVRSHRREQRDARRVARELPVVTDLLAVAIGAGANPVHAVELAQQWAPPRAATYLRRVREARANGATLTEALELVAERDASWAPITDALLVTERLGAPIGPSLARVSETQRAELRREAEAHARRVPVRLLFPLVFLVLPAFGLLTVVPVLISGLTTL